MRIKMTVWKKRFLRGDKYLYIFGIYNEGDEERRLELLRQYILHSSLGMILKEEPIIE